MAERPNDGSIADVAHIHPPKIEYFDLDAKSNTDPKGQLRSVDEYRLTPTGLYMFRPLAGHPKISHFESWFLPKLNIRVTRQSWHPGHQLDHGALEREDVSGHVRANLVETGAEVELSA